MIINIELLNVPGGHLWFETQRHDLSTFPNVNFHLLRERESMCNIFWSSLWVRKVKGLLWFVCRICTNIVYLLRKEMENLENDIEKRKNKQNSKWHST